MLLKTKEVCLTELEWLEWCLQIDPERRQVYFQDGSLSCVQLVVYINILGHNHREKALNNSSYNLLAFYPKS